MRSLRPVSSSDADKPASCHWIALRSTFPAAPQFPNYTVSTLLLLEQPLRTKARPEKNMVLILPAALLSLVFAVVGAKQCTIRTSIPFDANGNYVRTISTGRQYTVHMPLSDGPNSYDHTVPRAVVLSFHGHGVTSGFQQVLSNLSHPALKINGQKFITVYPQALLGIPTPCLNETVGRYTWQGAPYSAPGVNDVR